jgi:hypothetical protein
MPLQKLQFRPGLNREGTDYSNEGGWYDGDKIRFRSGFPEKIGGWTQYASSQFLGVARALWTWVDLSGNNYLGVGTSVKYYIEQGGTYNDITPIYKTDNPLANNPFTTAYSTLNGTITSTATSLTLTSAASFPVNGIIKIDSEQIAYATIAGDVLSGLTRGYNGTTAASHTTGAAVGSPYILVTDAAYQPSVGDYILFSGATSVNGITVSGEYVVYNIPSGSGTTYYIATTNISTTTPVFSTAAATGGGAAVKAEYLYPSGSDFSTSGTGWSTGAWSRGTWSSAGPGVGVTTSLRLWSNDNYGQDLYIAPRGGGVYVWQDSGGLATRAQLLQTVSGSAYVPNTTNQVLSASIQQFIICMGANPYVSGTPGSTFNPMLVRWSDQANPNQWVPQVTNQSGEFALTNGSYIMGARTTRQEILVWTDSAVYSMQYLGAPYVWGFQILMDNITIMSPNAMITVNNVTYWMGRDKFYVYSGTVQTLPCSVRQYVFDGLNINQNFQVFCGSNEGYNEVWWFYCSANSNTIDSYVIYNYLDQVWYYGSMARTAWLSSTIKTYPIAADYNNRLLNHENGVDDVATGSALPIDAYVQSSDFDIGDGHNFGFVWRILPDVNFNGSYVNQPYCTMTIKPRVNSGTAYGQADNPTVQSADNYSGTKLYNIQQFTGQVYTRLRGRQLAFRIESNSIGVAWQLGSPRIDIRPDGRR